MAQNEYAVPLTITRPPPRPRTPWGYADIAMAIGLVILGTIAVSVPAAIAASSVAGDVKIDEDAGGLAVVLAASLVLEVVMIVSAALFSLRRYRVPWADLGLRRPRRGALWLPAALVITALILVYAYFALLSLAGAEPGEAVPEEAFTNLAPLLLLAVLSLAFAPIAEEIFFRGFIFGGLRGRWGTPLAALASGLLFGLAHLGNPGSIYAIVPIAGVGALFAFGYAYSGSLLATIGAHFLFNLVMLIAGLATT